MTPPDFEETARELQDSHDRHDPDEAPRAAAMCPACLAAALRRAYREGLGAAAKTVDRWVIGTAEQEYYPGEADRWRGCAAEIRALDRQGGGEVTKRYPELESQARELALTIKAGLPPGVGFTVFLFDVGDGGGIAYMSSARRDDMIATLKEFIAYAEGRKVEEGGHA